MATKKKKKAPKKRALGRGFSALIPENSFASDVFEGETLELEFNAITLPSKQPRRSHSETGLRELAASIKQHGIVQPLIVRKAGRKYQLIAGERRLRAAKKAGLKKLPVRVLDIPENQVFEVALVENLQREDLNPIEEAQAFRELMKLLDLTQAEVAARTGKERSTVTNRLRLLGLSEQCRKFVIGGQLTSGHAKALLALDGKANQDRLARKIISEGLSVRQAESLARGIQIKGAGMLKKIPAPKAPKDIHIRKAEEKLRKVLSAPVEIRPRKKGGVVEIQYVDDSDLHRIFTQLTSRKKR